MKVQQFYNKNQFIITSNFYTAFQSYNSTIAEIDNKGVLRLSPDWDYSNTTLKHLYLFIKDYFYNNGSDNLQYNYFFNHEKNFYNAKNKKQFIQHLIDNSIISVSLKA